MEFCDLSFVRILLFYIYLLYIFRKAKFLVVDDRINALFWPTNLKCIFAQTYVKSFLMSIRMVTFKAESFQILIPSYCIFSACMSVKSHFLCLYVRMSISVTFKEIFLSFGRKHYNGCLLLFSSWVTECRLVSIFCWTSPM